jgi:hypothetical protein
MVIAMVALLVALVAGVAVAKTFVCKSIPCYGTNNNDQIGEREGSVQDIIKARGGADTVNAKRFGSDEDRIFGQKGNDKINTDDGDDRDVVNCGSGTADEAIIDAGDRTVKTDAGVETCETIIVDP